MKRSFCLLPQNPCPVYYITDVVQADAEVFNKNLQVGSFEEKLMDRPEGGGRNDLRMTKLTIHGIPVHFDNFRPRGGYQSDLLTRSPGKGTRRTDCSIIIYLKQQDGALLAGYKLSLIHI